MVAIVCNLFGGPGCRKSTLATHVFAELKWLNVNCEYASEYAKDKVWEKSLKVLKNQMKVFGEQHHRVWRLLKDTDLIITDSPSLMSIVYNKTNKKEFQELVVKEFARIDSLNIFVKRKADYNPKGRNQTLEEAIKLDKKIESLLIDNNIEFQYVDGIKESVPILVDLIMKKLTDLKNKKDLKKVKKKL